MSTENRSAGLAGAPGSALDERLLEAAKPSGYERMRISVESTPSLRAAADSASPEYGDDDYCYEGPTCGMCGDDGWIMLSDAGPGEWGEDFFCGEDQPIECPECRDRRRFEAAMTKSPNAEALPPGGKGAL